MPPTPLIRYWEEHGGSEPRLDALLAPCAPPSSAAAGGRGGARGSMRRNMTWTCGAEDGSMEASAHKVLGLIRVTPSV